MIGENIYKHKREVKYLLKNNESDKLIIIFSGYSKSPNPELKAPYNYIKVLRNSNKNQLYIADSYGYDGRGCWYLCEDGNYDVEESIISLINYVMSKLNIKKENVILTGTSKGGFASLYYGIKYGFKHVIAGAPQIFICDYLSGKENEKILERISNDLTEKNYINNILSNMIIPKDININILCGIKDYHLNCHINPFIKRHSDININLLIYYGKHTDLPLVYGKLINNMIDNEIESNNSDKKIINIPRKILFDDNISITYLDKLIDDKLVTSWYEEDENKIKTFMQIVNVNFEYACYLQSENRDYRKIFYTDEPYFEFSLDGLDITRPYNVKWFLRDKFNNYKTIISKIDILK